VGTLSNFSFDVQISTFNARLFLCK
jgi:hypothetical protein